MSSAMRKFILVSLTLFTFAFATPAVFAQTPPATGTAFGAGDFKAPEADEYLLVNRSRHTISCGVFGTSNIGGNHRCGDYDSQGHLLGYAQIPNGGAVGSLSTGMVAMFDNPPVSTTQYLASVGTSLGLIPEARAQQTNVVGSGNNVVLPILSLWEIIRNISYFGFIIVILTIGFMIMFRTRFNPQTVVTFQMAIPKLVIGLILVTFSYLIAAILLDASFVIFQLVALLFGQVGNGAGAANGLGDTNHLQQIAQSVDIFGLFGGTILNGNSAGTVVGPISTAVQSATGGIQPGQNFIFNIIQNPFGTIAGGVIGALLYAILALAVLFQMLRLFWAMVQAYISILVNTILGPIFILYGTIPGRQGSITFWWKNILGNAMIFPAIFAAFLFAGMIVASPQSNFNAGLPLLSFPQGTIRAILAFGIILGTPAIPKMVKGAIGVKDFNEFAATALAGAATGYGAVSGAGAYAYGGLMEATGMASRRQALQKDAVEQRLAKGLTDNPAANFWARHFTK